MLQWCGLLAAQDSRRTLLNAIYEQVTRGTAGYDDLVDSGDITYGHVEDQVVADGSLCYPDLAHDDIPEGYRLRLQTMHNQFVDTMDLFREQLEISRAQQLELHADLLAAEYERERLVSKRQGAKARCAEAEVTVSKLRADLSAAMEHLDRQTETKDRIIQSVTEKSQVAHVRLKYAEDKITYLNAKVQKERDRRHRKTSELLAEQVRVQERHESEIRRLEQEVHDTQEQLDSLRGMSDLQPDGRSLLDTCQPPLPPRLHTSPIFPATNVEYSPSQGQEDVSTHQDPSSEVKQDHRVALEKLFGQIRQDEYESAQDSVKLHPVGQPPLPPECILAPPVRPATTHQDPTSEVKQDHWVALEKLFGWMREEEYESPQDAVRPNDEQQEVQIRLQDELAMAKEQLCMVEQEYQTVRCDLDQSRVGLRELKSHIASLQSEWEMCKAMLWEAQDARRSSLIDLAQVIKLLRVSQTEREESQFRCSQVTFLCEALQERITELEAKSKKRSKECQATTPVHTDSESQTCCPTDTGTGMYARQSMSSC